MTKLANTLYFKAQSAKDSFCRLWKNERGEANIIAIILVLAIVIALAIIFRQAIGDLFKNIWGSITNDIDDATQNYENVTGLPAAK